jgi:hypothetical protein
MSARWASTHRRQSARQFAQRGMVAGERRLASRRLLQRASGVDRSDGPAVPHVVPRLSWLTTLDPRATLMRCRSAAFGVLRTATTRPMRGPEEGGVHRDQRLTHESGMVACPA